MPLEDLIKSSSLNISLNLDKAEDIVSINLTGRTPIADFLIIATGLSQRHLSSMADHIQKKLKEHGFKKIPIEGGDQCEWILLDVGDVVVHLFREEVRNFYNLEKIWLKPINKS
mgnify:CR=1 FL=1